MDFRKFFKAYDMRGTFGEDFDLATVRRIGEALPGAVNARHWLVGRDCRETRAAMRDALCEGLAAAGAHIVDAGLCTTPMVYFFTAEDGYDASVMITASHNPPGDNGMKVSGRDAVPVGFADGLERVLAALTRQDGSVPVQSAAAPREFPAPCAQRYIAWHKAACDDSLFAGLRYAVDCSSGMASLLAKDLFPGATILNGVLDGTFAAHSPNPLSAEAREQAVALVREQKLDCAVVFDGDADRAMFIDETGAFIQPDYLIPIVYEATKRGAGAARDIVLHDVRTSRGAIETLRELGAEPVMVSVGHVFAKRVMRERGALCGGELAGHYYFSEFHNCDSGMLAARRILGAIAAQKRRGGTFSQLVKPIVSRYANSGERNFRVADKPAAVGRVMEAVAAKFPPELSHSRIDGLRCEFEDGWFNIRASNTEPFLRLVAEAKTPELLADWLQILENAIG